MERSSRSDGPSRQEAPASRVIFVVRVLLVVVGLSPFLATLFRPLLSPFLADLLYALFSPVCHRKALRTLFIASELMPICSRCAGIFAGFVLSGLLPLPRLLVRQALFYGFVASVIMVGDVVMQDLGVHPVWHFSRVLTGILWGHVCGLGVLALVRKAHGKSVTSSG